MSTTKQRDPRKEQFWRRIIRQWGKSGLSARAFCRRQDLSEPSFYAWRRTLKQRDTEATRFIPVRVRPVPQTDVQTCAPINVITNDGSASALELLLEGGRRLRIGPAFDAVTLRRLLRLLEEADAIGRTHEEGRP